MKNLNPISMREEEDLISDVKHFRDRTREAQKRLAEYYKRNWNGDKITLDKKR